MGSITLHNLDDSLYMRIKQKARLEGKSLNHTIKGLLAESLGMVQGSGKGRRKKDIYAQLCGATPPEELEKLAEAEKDFEAIDPRDWK